MITTEVPTCAIAEINAANIGRVTANFSRAAVFTGCEGAIVDPERLSAARLQADFPEQMVSVVVPEERCGASSLGQLACRRSVIEKRLLSRVISVAISAGDRYNRAYYSDSLFYRNGKFVGGVSGFPRDRGFMDSLAAHIRIPDYVEKSCSDIKANVWISSGLTQTGLHYDAYDNFFLQVHGTKRWFIADCRQPARRFYAPGIFSDRESLPFYSAVENPFDYDAEAFPEFKKVKYNVVDLEPGQMLYLPYGWWHYVAAAPGEYNVSVSLRRVTLQRWLNKFTYQFAVRAGVSAARQLVARL